MPFSPKTGGSAIRSLTDRKQWKGKLLNPPRDGELAGSARKSKGTMAFTVEKPMPGVKP